MPKDTFFNLPEEKRERVIQVALEEFAQHGYAQASVSRMVRRAGIAKGSIYQYFDDKKDLYLYLIRLVGEAKVRFMAQEKPPAGRDFFEDFRGQLLAGARFGLASPRNQLYVQVASKMYASPIRDEMLAKMKEMSEAYLADLVRAAQEKGQIRTDVPVELVTYFLNAVMSEFHRYVARVAGVDPDRIAEPEILERMQGLDLEGIFTDLVGLLRDGLRKA